MKKNIVIITVAALLIFVAVSAVWAQNGREVWVGDFLLLTVRTPAAGYSIGERVNAMQLRINDLLEGKRTKVNVVVTRHGRDAAVYADGRLVATATPADARANRTTTYKLAKVWAQRLRTLYPRATPDKPGVGRPGM